MSKVTPVVIILSGSVGAIGSYHISPKRVSVGISPKIKVLFKNKYNKPLLNLDGDKAIWDSKWDVLKAEKPVHPKLKKAVLEKSNAEESKKLHKEGCAEIYNSSTMASPYFLDFKYYCSKTNKDVIGGDWIADDTKNKRKNEWDTALSELLTADKKDLHRELLGLIEKYDSKTPKKFDEKHRERLKEWCDSTGEKMYINENSTDFKNAKQFCLKKDGKILRRKN